MLRTASEVYEEVCCFGVFITLILGQWNEVVAAGVVLGYIAFCEFFFSHYYSEVHSIPFK